ncbi:site-specific integrase [Microbacterium enclense]|uniref:tyrosine-type recombinase/integrase n=1 Tax=Microbacterium enclense TaxID=993073 RepID=UPI00203EBB6E|nr:site-specific integrase [Microbacterium enclense]MCM3615783.1 site-specific integrase [Microbacterium enclense]
MDKRAHGQGQVTPYRDGFRIRWSLPDGGRSSKVIRPANRKKAEDELRKILSALDSGSWVDERRGTMTFDAMAADWLALRESQVTHTTFVNYKSLLKTTILPTFGGRKLNTITRRQIDIWWSKTAAHKVTRRNAGYVLKGILEQAVEWNILTVSPYAVKGAGKDASVQRPTWSVEDFDAVLVHVDPFYKAALEVMFSGHFRLGELVALNGSDVRGGMVSATKQRTGMGYTADVKYGQRKRIKLLERGRDALAGRPRVIGDAPLFPGERAERMPRRSLQDAWNTAVKAAGFTDFHVHDIRHISLSLVAEAGASEKVVQQRAGHSSATSTRRYMHTSARQHAEAVERVDALVARLVQGRDSVDGKIANRDPR